jgi:hypothetical protein
MAFSRDGGAYTIASALATRPNVEDLGSKIARRKPDQNPTLRQFLDGIA